MRSLIFPLLMLTLIGCEKAKQETNVKAGKEKPKIKSVTEFRYKFAFGEPEKEGEKRSYTTFTYDSTGKLSEKRSYSKDGELDQKTLYQYDIKGQLITEAEYERYKDFKDPTIASYKYNDSGKVIDYKKEWSKTTSLHYTNSYDSKGHLIEAVLYEGDGGVSRREKFVYDNSGKEIQQITLESKYNGKWISKYAEDGKITEKEWYKEYGTLDSKYTFVYDNHRRVSESIGRAYPEGRLYAKTTYKYDQLGRVTEQCDFTFSDVGEPTLMDKSVYEYIN